MRMICVREVMSMNKTWNDRMRNVTSAPLRPPATACLVFNGTSTQDRSIWQFVQTAGGWNRLSWLRMANETQCMILNTLHNVTQFTIKHSCYKNATTGYLIVRLTYLNITLAPSPIPSRITHTSHLLYKGYWFRLFIPKNRLQYIKNNSTLGISQDNLPIF